MNPIVAALRAMDERELRRCAARVGMELPAPGPAFTAGMHRARLTMPQMTEAEKAASREWLAANGFEPRGLWERRSEEIAR